MINSSTFPVAPRRCRRASQRQARTVLLAGLVAVGSLVGLAEHAYGGGPNTVLHVHVHSGDTLWSIASSVYGSGSVGDKVDAIVTINHLDTGTIQPGEVLTVPAP